jgi:hypothetical protein
LPSLLGYGLGQEISQALSAKNIVCPVIYTLGLDSFLGHDLASCSGVASQFRANNRKAKPTTLTLN